MLKFYRKHIKLFIWVIVLSFIAWGVGTISISKESASPYIGSVRGEKISHKEFLTTLRYYDFLTRSQAFENVLRNKEAARKITAPEPPSYDQLRYLTWQAIVLSREAKRAGITVSDQEVQSEVEKLFSTDGEFNQGFYQNWIDKNLQGRPRDFEEAVRTHLAGRKIREKVLEGVPEEKREAQWLKWLRPMIYQAQLKDGTASQPQAPVGPDPSTVPEEHPKEV